MYCNNNKFDIAQKRMKKLQEKIKKVANVLICVGIAKVNLNDTFERWKQRAIYNVGIAKEKLYENLNVNSENNEFYPIYSDINDPQLQLSPINANSNQQSQLMKKRDTTNPSCGSNKVIYFMFF